MKINLYTDGASRGNPGPGGYGLILTSGDLRKEFSAAYRKTTNNRMELMAVIAGLEKLRKEGMEVTIYTDSRYVADAINKKWLFGWAKKNFKGKKNPDLWKRFLKIYPKHNLRFVWIRGHNDHPMNERCDELATEAADSGPWLIDQGYEQG